MELSNKLMSQPIFPPKSQIKRHKMIYHCKFGEFGVLEGQFTEPSGVAVNAQNDIIVADTNNHRIQVWQLVLKIVLNFSRGRLSVKRGAYNRTYSPALQQAKFYFLQQSSAARVCEIQLPESMSVPESMREGAGVCVLLCVSGCVWVCVCVCVFVCPHLYSYKEEGTRV